MKIINKDQVSYIEIFNETKGVWSNWGYLADLYYVPFKAVVKEIYDSTIWVESLVTSKLYELYYNQILESMNIEEIKSLLNLDNYGR